MWSAGAMLPLAIGEAMLRGRVRRKRGFRRGRRKHGLRTPGFLLLRASESVR